MRPRRRCVSRVSLQPATFAPSNQYSPSLGASSRPRMPSSVDLPQPEGPVTARYSPASMSRSMRSSAVVSTSPLRCSLLSWRSLIIGVVLVSLSVIFNEWNYGVMRNRAASPNRRTPETTTRSPSRRPSSTSTLPAACRPSRTARRCAPVPSSDST